MNGNGKLPSNIPSVIQSPKLYTIPINERPKRRSFQGYLATAIFLYGCLCVHGTQYLVLPLLLISRKLYQRGIGYTKGAFAKLLILVSQLFAPTEFIITTEGMDDSVIVKDAKGKVVGLNLPEKLVIISNHQVYLDWWYIWALTYYMHAETTVLITLKNTLKWIPVVGWGMQFYEFIFLARSWAADRITLGRQLTQVGQRAQQQGERLSLMIFPEGTLISKDTQPLSKKYADKVGIANTRNCLLPRSTGLLFALRTLSPYVPDLHVLDLTVGYPGIPPAGYGQSWYTLRSVLLDGTPPPAVNIHMRMYQVRRDIPIGDVGNAEDGNIGRGADASPGETKVFEDWLVQRWREKDDLLDTFYQEGQFRSGNKPPTGSSATARDGPGPKTLDGDAAVHIPLELRSWKDALDAFCFSAPAFAVYALLRFKRSFGY